VVKSLSIKAVEIRCDVINPDVIVRVEEIILTKFGNLDTYRGSGSEMGKMQSMCECYWPCFLPDMSRKSIEKKKEVLMGHIHLKRFGDPDDFKRVII